MNGTCKNPESRISVPLYLAETSEKIGKQSVYWDITDISGDSSRRAYALVTGASSGIGLEFCKQLATEGWPLWMVSNEKEILYEVAAHIYRERQVPVIATDMDLAQCDSAECLYEEGKRLGVRVSLLINDAGVFSFRDLTTTSPGRIDLMLSLHTLTVTKLCHFFGKEMQLHGEGYILNLSSLSAWLPFPGITLYSATKAYVRTFTRAFALEMRPNGVKVMTVCPGGVATGLYGLSSRWQHIGLRLGVLMSPEKLVRHSLRALYAGKRQLIPGFLNRFFIPVMQILPIRILLLIRRKLAHYER